jgi:hypothetical protein
VLRCILIGMTIGAVAELGARVLKLWIYRQPQTPILNVVAVFGLIMGGVATLVPTIGVAAAFVIAFAFGLIYEIANLRVLNWWYFPGERLAFLRGHTPIVVVIALLWGFVPVVIAGAQSQLPGARRARAPGQTRLQILSEREQQLIEKLDAVRQRERDLETRLEDVRALKQALLAREAVRRPGKPERSPHETPAP